MILHLRRWVVICKKLTEIEASKHLRHCKILMFSTFLCKENLLMYSAYCHIKQISWCCCNYFVQWTEIQSMSENQTTSAEIVLCRIPIMFSASNHLVLAACMLKGPFSFVRKPFFIQVYLKGNCT